MNILFVNYTFPKENSGGTERALSNIAKYLNKKHQIKVFACYFEGDNYLSALFEDSIKYMGVESIGKLEKFINDNNVKIVINFKKILPSEIKKLFNKYSIYIISSLRYAPNDAISKISTILDYKMHRDFKLSIKKHLKKIYIMYVDYISKKQIKDTFNNSHKYVISSLYYLPEIMKTVKRKDIVDKISIIPNMLSYEYDIRKEEIDSKINRILFVGRLEEKSKRLSIAINIWKKLIEENNLEQWEFDIIGEGSDREKYENMVISGDIKNINFYGKIDPFYFYLKSKIFLLTSSAEGFPNVLLEAQQFGCVPVVFNSFASLKDIIEDNSNGFIVENNNIQAYYSTVLTLMKNPVLLNKMAVNGTKSSKKYSTTYVGELWSQLLIRKNIHE